jgi:O-methyltransferase domain
LGLDAHLLRRFLIASSVLGICTVSKRSTVRLTRVGRALQSEGRHSMRQFSRYVGMPSTVNGFLHYGETLRTGMPGYEIASGSDMWTRYSADASEAGIFAEGMRCMTNVELDTIVSKLLRSDLRPRTVCDIGGGIGTLIIACLQREKELRGILVDQPVMTLLAKKYADQVEVSHRLDVIDADFFDEKLPQADLYLLKDVIHDWDDDKCELLLKNIRRAMRRDSRLVLIEVALTASNRPHPLAPFMDLLVMAQTGGGRQRSTGELDALAGAAGLERVDVRRTAAYTVVTLMSSASGSSAPEILIERQLAP